VEVTNLGDAIGSKTIQCEVSVNHFGYSASQSITLAPAETRTYTITVDVPLENFFTSLNCSCYLV
jgi:hypothetical protein